jgi:hypothetical protein
MTEYTDNMIFAAIGLFFFFSGVFGIPYMSMDVLPSGWADLIFDQWWDFGMVLFLVVWAVAAAVGLLCCLVVLLDDVV